MKMKKEILKKLYKPLKNESGCLDIILVTGIFSGLYSLIYQIGKTTVQEGKWLEFDCKHKCKAPMIVKECEHGGKGPYNMRYVKQDLRNKIKGDYLIKTLEEIIGKTEQYDIAIEDDRIFELSETSKKRADGLKYVSITKKNDWKDNLAGIAYLCSLVGILDGLKVFNKKGYTFIIDERKEYDSLTFELLGYGFRDYGFSGSKFFERNQKDFEKIMERIDKKIYEEDKRQ